MTDEELIEHPEYVDGAQLAHSLMLKALLKDQPLIAAQLREYLAHFEAQPPNVGLSEIKRQSFHRTVESILGKSGAETHDA